MYLNERNVSILELTEINFCLISNNDSLLMLAINNNECFWCCLNKNQLTQQNHKIKQLLSLDEIRTAFLKYIENKKEQIKIILNNDNLKIECNDFFDNKMFFILHKSSFDNKIISIKNNSILSIRQNSSQHLLLSDNTFTNNKQTSFTEINLSNIYSQFSFISPVEIFSSIYVFIFHFIISLLLITSLILLCLNFKSNSNIHAKSNIASIKEFNLISNWINPNDSFEYALLYRASSDGDDAKIFHKLCDLKNPTLTLISTTEGWRFGGYTDIYWTSFHDLDDWEYRNSQHIFIFSLNKQKKYPSKNKRATIFSSGRRGPSFGNGLDFSVTNRSFTSKNYCNSPVSFSNMVEKNEFIGGKDYFYAKEVEVFLVINKHKK